MKYLLVPLLVIGVFISCKKDKEEIVEYVAEYNPAPYNIVFKNNTLPTLEIPLDNPLTIEKVKLGKMLFYDSLLSRDNTVSCATCHLQSHAFSDPDRFSEGVNGGIGGRQAMGYFQYGVPYEPVFLGWKGEFTKRSIIAAHSRSFGNG